MNALYLDYHGGYTGLYIFQNLLKCTIELVILLYANYTSIKIFFLDLCFLEISRPCGGYRIVYICQNIELYTKKKDLYYGKFCCYCCLVAKCVPLFCNPIDCSHQVLLSMAFSRQEYWSERPFSSPGDLPNPGIKPTSLALQVDSFPLSHQGSPKLW